MSPCPENFLRHYGRLWNNCYGTDTFGNGDKYVGEFKEGQYHGQGTYTYADGRVEKGISENNEFPYAQKATPKKSPPVIADDGKAIAAASGTGFAVKSRVFVQFSNFTYISDRR